MSEESRLKYTERPTTPPETDDDTVFYRDSRSVYSEDGEKFIKMSPDRGFDFDHITEVKVLDGTKYICDDAFAELDNLQSIIIPDTITHIGDCAFLKCKSLRSIRIPDSVQSIGYQAFADCSSLRRFESILASEDGRCLVINNELVAVAPCELEELHIPENVHSIAAGVFRTCPELRSVYLPESLVTFPLNCFTWCKSLESIYSKNASEDHQCIIINDKLVLCIEHKHKEYSIPIGVNTIGVGAFGRNTIIQKIVLPSSVKSIETGAFAGCTSLTQITIPFGMETIGYGAFHSCEQLNDIILPNSINEIGASAFQGCKSLKCVSLPNRLKSIAAETFKGCSSLISITIPDTVSSIGESAFEGCKELEAIVLPSRLTGIESKTFIGCVSLKNIILPSSIKTIKRMSFYGCNGLKTVSFPSSLQKLDEISFLGCSSLEEIDLSRCSYLEQIEERTFDGCSGLKRLVLSESIHTIKEEAFQYCSSLETLVIPESVKVIEYEAFRDCGMKSVYFPSTDIDLNSYAFRSCRNFETVYIPNGTLSFFEPLLRSLSTINYSGHMAFIEVGDSVSDVKAETRRILSDSFISKPLARLGLCDRDYRTTSERTYVIHENGERILSDIKVVSISCYSSCTGCVRIGKNVVYNWPGDPWLQDGSSKRSYPDNVMAILRDADSTEDIYKQFDLLRFALKLLLVEIQSKEIVLDEALQKVISYELSDEVEKGVSYTAYDTGKDPSSPASMVPPPGARGDDGRPRPPVGIINVIIRILGELLHKNEQQ